jgi:hypothetical protein
LTCICPYPKIVAEALNEKGESGYMSKEKKRKKKGDTETIEKTVDSYTGELKPVPEDADQFIEVVPEETKDRDGKNYLLHEESSMDSYAANADAVADQSAHYTDDEDIKKDFDERQDLAVGGRDELLKELEEHHSLSPEVSGGDIDASWQTANVAGEETVGGSSPTPDQDVVDDLGRAAGLTYADDEPLNSDKKVLDRDRNRWELNPASADDQEEIEEEGEFDEDADEVLLDDEFDGDEYIDAEVEEDEER